MKGCMNQTMHMRKLGKTGLEVSCIGLGGMGFMLGGSDIEKRCGETVRTALAGGVNVIDTARTYYSSESLIGAALDRLRDRYPRPILSSKTYRRDADGAYREVLTSLKTMQVKTVDIYYTHHVQYDYELKKILEPGGALEGLKRAREEGLIKCIGISSHHPGVMLEAVKSDRFDVIQVPLNPVEKEQFLPAIEEAGRREQGIFIMKPLAGGHIQSVEAALKFALSFDVSCVLVGASTPEEITLDIQVGAQAGNLTDEEKTRLQEEINSLDEQFCRRCRYCEKHCPEEIKIADVFRCENYLILNATYAREEYRRLGKNASCCQGCGRCEEICPYNLPIRDMLTRAHKRLTTGRIEDTIIRVLRKLRLYDRIRNLYFKLRFPLPKR